ncbi:hypothetical protein [Parasphingorhabdus cellanae]|uniref:Type III secretion protein n=1 Tax=Parasphingorhabdus cellanae TaxID=2806553 RepID=A0ABX7T5N4_9SPHN|nr:hypothetical protein [Parasphingorhabdus cellanae]QTD56135.1 hypothetical protein J4G78_00555 [Parasphingorhabdus cellanae]
MSNDLNVSLNQLAATPSTGQRARSSNWFEAFANAWGNALDNQANEIEMRANTLTEGQDSPSQITLLTAESMRLSFMSQSSHTSMDSISKALETMARKS